MTEIEGQLIAFPSPLTGLQLTAYYSEGDGWALTVAQRRVGTGWSTAERYDRMIRPELLDVLLEAAIRILELADQR